jgi:hypothetical protein
MTGPYDEGDEPLASITIGDLILDKLNNVYC